MTKLDWENITNYIDSVGTTDTVFPFTKVQSSVKVTASGARDNIIYTIGGQSGTLTPGQSVTVTGTISSMTLRSASGKQPFQVWATEAGTEKDETDTSYQGQIDGLTTQLAQSTSQTVLVAAYQRQGAETDDTALIQRALNAIGNNGKLIFPPKQTYTVGLLTLPTSISNLIIEGNGSNLISNLSVNSNGASGDASQFTILKDTVNTIKSNLIPTADITQGDNTLSLSASDISGIQVGDIVLITTTKANVNFSSYKLGSERLVRSIDTVGNKLIFEDGIENSLSIATDSVKANVYRPVSNLKIKNLNFQLVNNGFQGGMWFQYVNGLTIKDCAFTGGGQQFWGVNANGFNIRISNIDCYEFLDNSLSFGYGVIVSGHNIRVNKSTFYKCKHGIAGGASSFVNTDFGYYHNYATDPQLCGFDAHGSCDQVKMINNVVVNAGKSYAAAGLWARGNNFEIKGNTVRAAKGATNSVSAFKILEVANNNISITDNQVYDCDYGIKGDEVSNSASVTSLDISRNRFSGMKAYGIRLNKVIDAIVSDNRIDCNAFGIFTTGADNSEFKNNIVKYGGNQSSSGIYFESMTDGLHKGIDIIGNRVTALSASASVPIRVRNNYDILNISNNNIDTTLGGGSTPIMLSEDTTLTKIIREKNIGETYYTSLPSANSYDRNRTIIVQGNGTSTADKYYMCMESATGTFSWVQVATG